MAGKVAAVLAIATVATAVIGLSGISPLFTLLSPFIFGFLLFFSLGGVVVWLLLHAREVSRAPSSDTTPRPDRRGE
jgi:hypothetical protein